MQIDLHTKRKNIIMPIIRQLISNDVQLNVRNNCFFSFIIPI